MYSVGSKSSSVISKWTTAITFVICAMICVVLYQAEGKAWLFSRLLTKHDFGGSNTTTSITLLPWTNERANRETLYDGRRRDVMKGCEKINRTVATRLDFNRHNLLYERKHLIFYCPIAKVGSTFWKRVLTVMASQGRLKSPFQITLSQVNLDKLSSRDQKILKENGTSFMFVRDPYARLFSGYENKIYHSNLLFWKTIGRHVVRVVRGSDKIINKRYGFDVSFPEFIKYILYLHESGKHVDAHFSPMISHCDPCSVHFQYIGKLETIKDDSIYLISKWRRDFDDFKLHFDDFEKETVIDSVRGHLHFLFETKKILKEIKFPFIKFMLRTWRDLQIRGYLSKYIPFPFKDTDADRISQEDYMKAINKALSIPGNSTEVRLQRDEALIQAYRQVPMEDMEKIRKYLLNDCLLFGYDDRPLKLFDRTQPLDEDFLYLDGLTRD